MIHSPLLCFALFLVQGRWGQTMFILKQAGEGGLRQEAAQLLPRLLPNPMH
jgi:hypothetical protein